MDDDVEEVATNLRQNVIDAHNILNPNLKFVTVIGGTKGYVIYAPGGTLTPPLREVMVLYIESSSRQNILRVVAQVLSTSEISDDPIWPMKSLSIRKGNTLYEVLGYPEDVIGKLLDDILESEKIIRIEIVY